ncbi:hypothetical protein ACHQM5_000112 [Ranunculus cassubicifolius]
MPSSLKRPRDTPLEHPFSASGNKCKYCSTMGHNEDQCTIRITIKEVIAERDRKRARKRECEMCKGEHHILDCSILTTYRASAKYQRYNPDATSYLNLRRGDESYEPNSPTFSDPPYSPTSSEPIGEISSTTNCPICYKEHHGSPCPYWSSVPQGAPVSHFYPIICERCDDPGMDNNLWCPHCKMHATGYVGACMNCIVCGKDMSPDCCPYGAFIEKKNLRTGYICPLDLQ